MTLGNCVPGAPDTTTAGGALAGMAIADCAPGSDVALASNFLLTDAGTTTGTAGAAAGQVSAAVAAGAQPPAAEAAHAETAVDEHAKEQLELTLMALSSLIALLGIGLATWLWLRRPEQAARIAERFPGLHRLLLNKYYVDELYDVTLVQPVKIVSEDGLWRGMDVRLVDGAVNGTGQVVSGLSAIVRLTQSGSVKAYAAATLLGVVAILAFYLWR